MTSLGTNACVCEKAKATDILSETQKASLYSQELSSESLQVLEDYESLSAEIINEIPITASFEELTGYLRQKANKFFIDHFAELEKVVRVENAEVRGKFDDFDVPVRVYHVSEQPSKNLLMYVHGGGWMQGNLETHDYICRKLAKIVDIDVASLDYRLAPKNPYPIPLNDVLSVYEHYTQTDYENMVLSGDSAGGNLCAALCLKADEKRIKRPHAQILLYPTLGSDFTSKSFEVFAECLALTKIVAIQFFKNYIGMNAYLLSDKLVCPLQGNDMRKISSNDDNIRWT